MDSSVAKLSSPNSRPLADQRVRATVIAAARAIAERFGVQIISVTATDSAIEVELLATKLAAIGFAAELRRATNRWAELKKLPHLWPDPPPDAFSDDTGSAFPFDGSYEGWLNPE